MSELIKNVEKSKVFAPMGLVEVEEGRVNSLTLAQTPGCKVTLFAIDEGEGMSSHSAPGDAMVYVQEGTAQITINDMPHEVRAGEAVVIPAGAPHAVKALTAFKMVLTVVIGA